MPRLLAALVFSVLYLASPALYASGSSVPAEQAAGVVIGSEGFNELLGKQLGADSLKTEALPDGSFKLSNAIQTLSAHITPQGATFDSIGSSAGKGGFTLMLQQYGRKGAMQVAESSGIYEKDGVVYHAHTNGIAEKFSNTGSGIRQDFIVPVKLKGSGALQVQLAIEGATINAKNDGLSVKVKGSQRTLTYDRLKVTDVNKKTIPAHMQLLANNKINIIVDDSAAQYPLTIDPTVGDENWVSMGIVSGANSRVHAIKSQGNNVYVAGSFTVFGGLAANNIVKWDGSNWTSLGIGVDCNLSGCQSVGSFISALAIDLNGNVYAAGEFSRAGGLSVKNIAKWDGVSWSDVGGGMPYGDIFSLALGSDGSLYAAGYFSSAGGVSVNNIAKWDGVNWSAMGSGLSGGSWCSGRPTSSQLACVSSLAIDSLGVLYAGGGFTNAGGIAANYIARWDGNSWASLGSGMAGNYPTTVNSLVLNGDGKLYVGGSFSTVNGVAANNIAMWDGVSWGGLGAGVNARVFAIAFDSAGNLYAGGDFTVAGGTSVNLIARWNSATWAALNSGASTSSAVLTLAFDSSDNLYAGGQFQNLGALSTNNIAEWDGFNWNALFSSNPNTMLPSVNEKKGIAVDATGNIFVTGLYQNSSGVSISRVVKWDGVAWSNLGIGMNGGILVLAFDSAGVLYAAGSFTTADGVSTNRIAKWTGTTWAPLGSGVNGTVNSIVGDATGNIYVGGAFTTADGVTVNKIAKWNGSAWSGLGSGMLYGASATNASVSAMQIDSLGNLYVGGKFDKVNGVSASMVARWNGVNWNALGGGVDADVKAVAIDSKNNVFVGGLFTHAGGLLVNGLAKWNGVSWLSLGRQSATSVRSLAVDAEDVVYVGSQDSASGIDKWNGTWANLGSELKIPFDYPVIHTLAIDKEGNLLVAGYFLFAGDKVSSGLAKWTIVDTDGDHWQDYEDAFPNNPAEWKDSDLDEVGDNSDNCVFVSNSDQLNTDGDIQGNACDVDDDNDGILDSADDLPLDATETIDTDKDGIGNNADDDDDGDGVADTSDNCPMDTNSDQADMDNDAIGNVCDDDIDGDGFLNSQDVFPLDPTEWLDKDGDGVGDNSDSDIDGDGVANTQDAFPLDATASQDSDGDGFPDQIFLAGDDFETGDLTKLPWSSTGDALWSVVSNNKHAGNFSARSGDVEFGQQSTLSVTVNTGPELSFYLAISEQNCGSSWVDFYVDGDFVNEWYDYACTGIGWQKFTQAVTPGQHTFTWKYTSYDAVGNAAWIDDVNYGSSLVMDNCPLVKNPDQINTDGDAQGDACDPDDDNDSIPDSDETALGTDPLNSLDPPLAAISAFYIWGLDNHTAGASAFNTVWSNANGAQDSTSSCDTCTAAGMAITTTANGDGCTVSSHGVQCLWWGMDNGPVYWEEFLPVQVGGQTYNPIHDWDGYLKYVDSFSTLHNVATDASRISSDHHSHACIVSKTLGVYCWASHSGTDIISNNVPAALQNVSTVKDVAVGANHACAINGSTVQCWGDATSGKTTVLGAVNSPTQLAAGTDHTCAINADRTVSCWGDNTNGELGDVDMDGRVDGVSNALKISAGSHHTCAVTGNYATPSSLRVTCWGKNNMGQTSVPTDLTNGVEKPVNITAANDETCAIRAGQNVAAAAMICWPVAVVP